MKKAIALIMTMMLLCSTVVIASAAPSIKVETAPEVSAVESSGETKIDAKDLTVVAAKDAAGNKDVAAAKQEITAAKDVAEFLKTAGIDKKVEEALKTAPNNKVEAKDLTVHSLFDVQVTGSVQAAIDNGEKVTISFSVPEIKSNQTVVVLHKAASGWEVVPSAVEDGVVKATFESFSPVAILVDTVVSPQTGVANYEGVLAVGALVCVIALGYCLKRRKAA